MAAPDPIPVLVLAGGASRRMGMDKRTTSIDGVPMLLRTLGRLASWPTLLIVDPRDPPDLILPPHTSVVADTRPGEGPLAALEAGLTAANTVDDAIILVVAGDMPWLEPAILELLVERLTSDTSADLACLARDDRPQPLPLACRRSPILARVTALLDRGERRLRALLDGPASLAIPEPEWRHADPTGRCLMDIDTPADLARSR